MLQQHILQGDATVIEQQPLQEQQQNQQNEEQQASVRMRSSASCGNDDIVTLHLRINGL